MKISQTLRKPANWQDFESLCLILWRAEWKSEDIKKNGRNGQAQKGVDICGHREGENEYSGIQCKCKPGNKPLTTDEIDDEINNARMENYNSLLSLAQHIRGCHQAFTDYNSKIK